MTSFADFANVCREIENISSSLEMTERVAEFFKLVDTEELHIAIYFIMGDVFPDWSDYDLGVGTGLFYTSLSKASGFSVDEIKKIVRDKGDIGKTTVEVIDKRSGSQITFDMFNKLKSKLTLNDVYTTFKKIAAINGKGSHENKLKMLQYLFSKTTPEEAQYLARLVLEQLRIGVGEGIVRNAISKSFNVPSELIERGYMLTNDLGVVALAAKKGGIDEVKELSIQIDRPIKLMLAQVAPNILKAIKDMDNASIEWKFDGARLQIHKNFDDVTIFSRKLENITNSLPDVVSYVKAQVTTDTVILDAETFAIDEDGKPKPFQEILKRLRRKYDIEMTTRDIPITVKIFDVMYCNGKSLVDLPLTERRKVLHNIITDSSSLSVSDQIVTDNVEKVEQIYFEAIDDGHEGIMIKNPSSPYTPGKRGNNWFKKKPIMETLDLVVIGGEWGYGRRTNFIGSFTLACHDEKSGEYLPIARVGTGLTDENLSELTELFSSLILLENGRNLEFKPEVVFEVAFEEIQKSKNYASGYSLRFPRLVNLRTDKSADEIETLDRIKDLYNSQRK